MISLHGSNLFKLLNEVQLDDFLYGLNIGTQARASKSLLLLSVV